jgi:hypothetical protein
MPVFLPKNLAGLANVAARDSARFAVNALRVRDLGVLHEDRAGEPVPPRNTRSRKRRRRKPHPAEPGEAQEAHDGEATGGHPPQRA